MADPKRPTVDELREALKPDICGEVFEVPASLLRAALDLLAEAQGQLDELHTAATARGPHAGMFDCTLSKIHDMRADLAEAQRDTERLEAAMKHYGFTREQADESAARLRAAIDSARAK